MERLMQSSSKFNTPHHLGDDQTHLTRCGRSLTAPRVEFHAYDLLASIANGTIRLCPKCGTLADFESVNRATGEADRLAELERQRQANSQRIWWNARAEARKKITQQLREIFEAECAEFVELIDQPHGMTGRVVINEDGDTPFILEVSINDGNCGSGQVYVC